MALKPITVSQLNEYIQRIIGTDPLLGAVVVKGEITNLKYHSTGHVYFSITDAASKINCFLPNDYAYRLNLQLKDGMEVEITGSINVFKKNGTYSVYVKIIEEIGRGDLGIAFEKLKTKLNQEGLFDPKRKKPIPAFPNRIGVITSSTGAAVKDILKILENRNPLVNVIIFPVLVQGIGSAEDIASMIDFVNENYQDIDTLIVGRGGGSADDLWSFNEEIVARSIDQSRIPIISAVGHEIDFTIADLVADLRAETPTAAAQIAVADTQQLKDRLSSLRDDLYTQLSNKLMYNRLLIDHLHDELTSQINSLLGEYKNILETHRLILEENNPSKVLKNGYAVIAGENGHIVNSLKQLKEKENYHITLNDGTVKCQLIKIGSEEK